MIEYLLDTNIVSALVRDPYGPSAERIWERTEACCTSIIVLAELRYGLRKRPSPRRSALLERVLEALPALDWEHPAELSYAEIRAELERRGTPIGANDLWIAAHALALDLTLVTANEREFGRVPGLKVENWLT